MSDPLFDETDDGTPLSLEEREGLIPTHITLRGELNEFEQHNIALASLWAFARKRNVLNVTFFRNLHRRMLKDVWRWAGEYRTTGKNIGVDAWRIGPDLAQLVDDVRYWVDNDTYGVDEIAARFRHRLVSIHPFPNGNGRFARLAADLLLVRLGKKPFSWGSGSLVDMGHLRASYITALREADHNNYQALIEFVRS